MWTETPVTLVTCDPLKLLITFIYTVDPLVHFAQSGPAMRMSNSALLCTSGYTCELNSQCT